MKHPKDYSVDEVCLFFVSLELGHLVPKIRDNSVDGGLLVSLAEADFVNDLGLSGLQTKRVMRGIEFASDLSGGGEGKGASEEEAAALKEKIAALEKENRELKDEVMNLRAALQPEPPKQQPQYYSQPPPPQQCHHHRPPPGAPVVREAAKGTARGAVLGAVAGAVAGDPAKGAAMGAAVGATAGGMRGLGERRRARMVGRF